MKAIRRSMNFGFGVLITFLALSWPAVNSARPVLDGGLLADAGTLATGEVSNAQKSPQTKNSFDAAVAAAGNTDCAVVITPGIWMISNDLVVPSNVTLKVERGAVITIADGKVLTINGTIEAGTYRIFSCIGTGRALLGPGSSPEAFPEWWGVTGADDQTPINRAIAAVPIGSTVKLSNKSYFLNGPVIINRDGIQLKGSGWTLGSRGGSYLVWKGGAYPVVEIGNALSRDIKLEDFAIDGGNKATYGIKLSTNALFGTIRNVGVAACTRVNAAAIGLGTSIDVFDWQIEKCRLVSNFNGVQLFRANSMVLRDNIICDNSNIGVTAERCFGLTISGGDIENNKVANVSFSGGAAINAENIYMESGPAPRNKEHRCFLIQRDPSNHTMLSLTIRGNYIANFSVDATPDYFIEIGDQACHWAEISSNFFGRANKRPIKNGKGNFGRADNNCPSTGTKDLFDDDSGWSGYSGPPIIDEGTK